MKRIILLSSITSLALVVGFVALNNDSPYAKISKSMETFGAVFREIQSQYVDEVDPELVIDAGIDAMLDQLDPYSEYMKADESEDIDILSNGSYTGFGIIVNRIDSVLFITGIRKDGPAAKAGMRIGDRLASINGVRVDTLTPAALRPYTKGAAGSFAAVRVVRDGSGDTLNLQIQRTDLPVENVTDAVRLTNGIGYIKLTRFSRRTAYDVRLAIEQLKSEGTLTGLIMDLRDNPGGLLEAAVSTTELFVAKGSVIVSTRGKNEDEAKVYTSKSEPLEPTLPLAVIINDRSASASEIFAGAIQDLDRGVIVGKRSFGKGLVQSVFSLPYDATMKLTTSRYYTPSGRSIQAINYAQKRAQSDNHKTTRSATVPEPQERKPLTYKTSSGRLVEQLHGIDPDTTVSDSTLPGLVQYLVQEDVVFRFVNQYTADFNQLPAMYSIDRIGVEQFIRYVEALPEQKRSPVLRTIQLSKKKAIAEGWTPTAIKAIEASERAVEKEIGKTLRQNEEALRNVLDTEIYTRFAEKSAKNQKLLSLDPSVKIASKILSTRAYSTFLTPQVPTDQ